ncbi:hypothetical protein BCR37DRAFT_379612 [Protomyces lactucae-debilis]|uniref:BZIP domain-containing protein n=1 Tax=Protomyces lactucae-debilis TaxID=2754530 RepID=A0A1Y2FF98_PROLT|nr:uncharacterized protein BCR37DRAFT_379612 [Protomyces lactucae-debilis]ORY82603.1 hypothetical protein BCR37DRAFT_379612 [Protomyces lactucae-debilis]
MTDTMDAFVNLDDMAGNAFADEYDTLNQCEVNSPSSEEQEMDMTNSVHGLPLAPRTQDEHMADIQQLAQLSGSLGTSWDASVVDSLEQMHVNPLNHYTTAATITAERLPGSWPAEKQRQMNPISTVAAPAAFSLSHIAPPSLPQERSSLSATSSACGSVATDERDPVFCSDAQERSPKRRASESAPRKAASLTKSGHKRSVSNATVMAQETQEVKVEETQGHSPSGGQDENGDNDASVMRRQDRLMRNRAAALASRERKREHVIRLEATLAEMEQDAASLKKENSRLQAEMARMQALLNKYGIKDDSTTTKESQVAKLAVSATRSAQSEAEQSSLAKLKAAPTGFSPRGALKKSQILADPVAAEEYLRQVALRQPPVTLKGSTKDKEATSSTATKQSGRGNAVIMVLCFGIALFASVHPTASGGLTISTQHGHHSAFGSLAAVDAILGSPAAVGAQAGNEAALQNVIEQFKMQGFQLTDSCKDAMQSGQSTAATMPMTAPRSLLTEAIHAHRPEVMVVEPKEATPLSDAGSHADSQTSSEANATLLTVPDVAVIAPRRISKRRSSRASQTIKEETET